MKTIHEQITLSNGTTCDKGIVRLIEYLNANGYETIFSCEGGNEPAYVMFERSKNLDYIFKLTRNFTGIPNCICEIITDSGSYALVIRENLLYCDTGKTVIDAWTDMIIDHLEERKRKRKKTVMKNNQTTSLISINQNRGSFLRSSPFVILSIIYICTSAGVSAGSNSSSFISSSSFNSVIENPSISSDVI